MKNRIRKQIKAYLRSSILQTREALGLTQEQMAHRLLLSTRAYAKLEAGGACCSLVTILIFLSRCCSDPNSFLDGLLQMLSDFDFSALD